MKPFSSVLLIAYRGFALGAIALVAARGAPSGLPVIPAITFNVADYGAVADGVTDNRAAIQAALNAARSTGGTVEIPAAEQAYRSGPLIIYGKTNLQIDAGATLQALPFGAYPNSMTSPSHFITINSGSTHVAITGGGTIDGDGQAWWTAYEAKMITNRPRLVQVNRADIVLIAGVTLTRSPMFHLAFSASNNVTIDGVTITSPEEAPNSDGIDPAGLHYLIKNCRIAVGDDNIAIKAGSSACGDITIVDCAFGTGHGLSIGGQTNAGLDGLVVDRCTFEGTTSGLRLKADATQGGLVQNLSYANITMKDVQYPIVFYSYYVDVGTPGSTSGSNQTTPAKVAAWNAAPPNSLKASTISRWRNITLANITATGATGYSVLWGLPLADALISNVVFDHVQLAGAVGLELFNVENVRFTGDSKVIVPEGVPAFVSYNALALTTPPVNRSAAVGAGVTLTAEATGTAGLQGTAPSFRWSRNGAPVSDGVAADGTAVAGAATATLSLANVQPAAAGCYTVALGNALDTYDATLATLTAGNTTVAATSEPAVLGVTTTEQVTTGGQIVGTNIVHPNGGVYDQVLLTGAATTITARPGRVTRISFVDLTDDIVQVEFSGAGALTLALDEASGPAAPVNYTQPGVAYMRGHAGIVITDADETTNLAVFSVGRATAFDPTGRYDFLRSPSDTNDPAKNGSGLFAGHETTSYDGLADLAFIAIASANGRFGGLRAANTHLWAHRGLTGVYAPGVQLQGPVYVGNVSAYDSAAPVLLVGGASDPRIAGGDLLQPNGQPVRVSGLTKLNFTRGLDSAGRSLPAQANRAVLMRNGVDVSAELAAVPAP